MAQRFPFYSERILRFREACQKARQGDATRLGTARLTFHQVIDPIAQNILGDLLMARRISVPFERGRTFFQKDEDTWFDTEADKMTAELGFQDDHREEMLNAITPDEIIKAVLNGKLNLSAQTQFLFQPQG